jgi:hypothetical protein
MRHDIQILTAVLLAARLAPAAAADYEHQVNADPKGAVEIVNVSGAIHVTAWDRPEVHVAARLDNSAERVDVQSEQGRTVVRVVLPGLSFMSGGSADLNVQVPRGSRIDVSSVSATVKVTGIQGEQRLHSVSGDISADIDGEDAEIKTVSGDVRLRGSGRPGRLHVTTVSGDLHVEHAAGEVEAGTVNGSIEAHVDQASSVRASTTSGSMRFDGTLLADASLEAKTLSGQLRVRAQGTEGYQYDVSTFSGHIDDCFDRQPERTSRYSPGERLNGTVGAGHAHVSIRSMTGTVDLCDH